jgi:hypothetical protein
MFAHWQSLSGDDDPDTPWEEEEDLTMFFQGFRPDGAGLEAVFEGVAHADELLPRLREVYEVTAEGGEDDAYFIVRKPRPLAASRAAELCREHLEKTAQMAGELAAARKHEAADELRELLASLPVVEVKAGEEPGPPDNESPEGLIYEVSGDFVHHLRWDKTPLESHAHLLDEALYSLASDYNLARHILWPLYRHLTSITEPFAAYFELWKHGADYRFDSNDHVTVYVPNLVADA